MQTTVSPRERTQSSASALLLAIVVAAIVAFIAGRLSTPGASSPTGSADIVAPECPPTFTSPSEAALPVSPGGINIPTAALRPSPPPGVTVTPDAGARIVSSVPPVRQLVSALLHDADLNRERSPDAPLEQVANQVQPQSLGIAMVANAYPSVAADLHDEVRARLCTESISDTGQVVLLRMMLAIAPITDSVGIDCVLAQEQSEGLVLWTALQARRAARLPPTPETERWLAHATDDRTIRLLREPHRRTP